MESLRVSLRSIYVPFAITEPALLSALLYVAARRYQVLASGTPLAGGFQNLALSYKQVSLHHAIKATKTAEQASSDATVALLFVLTSEAVSLSPVHLIDLILINERSIPKETFKHSYIMGMLQLRLVGAKIVQTSLVYPSSYHT